MTSGTPVLEQKTKKIVFSDGDEDFKLEEEFYEISTQNNRMKYFFLLNIGKIHFIFHNEGLTLKSCKKSPNDSIKQ